MKSYNERLFDAYEIKHDLYVRTTAEGAANVKIQLEDLCCYQTKEEAYFTTIKLCERGTTEETRDRYHVTDLHGFWFVHDLEAIEAIAGEAPMISNPRITLEQALDEVNASVKSVEEEHERLIAIAQQYSEAIEHLSALHEYGYEGTAKHRIARMQSAMNQQAVLEEISDQLTVIANCLKEITGRAGEATAADLQHDLLNEQREQM